MAEGRSRERCHFYNTQGGCWFGDQCRFLHVKDDVKPICHFYRGPGTCRNGDHCYYRHTQNTETVRAQNTTVAAQGTGQSVKAQLPKENIANLSSKENVDQKEKKPLSDISNLVNKGRESFVTTNKPRKPPVTKAKVKKSVERKENNTVTDADRDKDETKGDKSGDSQIADSRNKSVTCGECGMKFEDLPDTDPLLDHYMEMFIKFDNKHLEFTRRYPSLDSPAICSVCNRFFCEVKDYIRHVKDKVKNGKEDAEKHRDLLENIAIDFCSRDIGIYSKLEFMDSLRTTLVSYYEAKLDSDDSDTEIEGVAAMISYIMRKKGLSGMLSSHDMFDDSDDDSDDNMFGFDDDDMFELACQGIKPWDPEAGAALAVLNGYY